MANKACFYIDDVIWTLQDLTRQRPASIFDQHLLKGLKTAHDLYGTKFQMNLFYRTDFYYGNDEFTLADMTDAYKEEFTAASDWLKLGFHAKQEFPDYPYINADYEDVKGCDRYFVAVDNEELEYTKDTLVKNSIEQIKYEDNLYILVFDRNVFDNFEPVFSDPYPYDTKGDY